LTGVVPAVDEAIGKLEIDLEISGSIKFPTVSGELVLHGGTLSYLPIGLRLEDIELVSEIQDNGGLELTGSFRSGDGRAEIRTRADQMQSMATSIELSLRGDQLTVVNVPDITAVADADVSVAFDGETLRLGGDIMISSASVRPQGGSMTRIPESNDVVLVGAEIPDEPKDDTEESNFQVVGSMVISLGEDVVVDLGVAEARVTGKSEFAWSGDPMPVANGRFDVDGEIVALGQRLEITQGSLRFPNVPADNPVIRVAAERDIYGNTQIRRAGVMVAGTLSRPTIEAYTRPLTTEQRAVTLLVTGSDFDYDKGIGAVDFGTYIAPKIYASYGVGLFDKGNVIRVRYDLKRGIGVTGTSGQQESGIDLSYRFEN